MFKNIQVIIKQIILDQLCLSMPIFFASSMIEMVVPYEDVKIGCRITKQIVGLPLILCCVAIEKVTESLEERIFGQTIPIDANNLMGTMPTKSDIAMLDEIAGLKDQAQYPGNLESINEATRKKCKELFPNSEPNDMMSSLSSTVNDFEHTYG